jgi:polyferredoxin
MPPYSDDLNDVLPVRSPWRLRNFIQLGVLALTLGIGLQFYIHVKQAAGGAAITVPRPAGVEGFLPIGAMMGWKQFLSSGIWDPVHPAGMVILGFAVLISVAVRKSFCSWFCPVGTVSEALWKLGRKTMGRNFRLPVWIDIPLRGGKYALLAFFVWAVFRMSAAAIAQFLSSPYYRMADVRMLHFFTRMSATTALVLTALVIMSFLYRNFWCRYFCPYGALMGLLALLSPLRIKRNASNCIRCRSCSAVCPHQIGVHRRNAVNSPECSGCMDCTLVCPIPETLRMETRRPVNRAWQPAAVGTAIVLLFVGVVYLAQVTGHWQSRLSTREFRMGLMMMEITQRDADLGKSRNHPEE